MKRFKEFLVEGRQRGDLHHFTSIGNAISILRDNVKRASPAGPNESPSISLTRNKNLHLDNTGTAGWRKGYKRDIKLGGDRQGVPTDVSFVLDGDKLSNKHKITPYSYQQNKRLWPEMEERVKGDIKNLKDYVKKIRVHAPIHPDDLKELESHGIPIEHTYK